MKSKENKPSNFQETKGSNYFLLVVSLLMAALAISAYVFFSVV